tara:strand:- start:1524 stop:1985 length:462 start_codon:yes stop_codon:yes gene_type:complete
MNAIVPVAFVEREILYRAVSASIGAISESITCIQEASNCEVGQGIIKQLDSLDIQCELQVAKAFVTDLEDKKPKLRAIQVALSNLNQVTSELGIKVDDLRKSVIEHSEMTRIGKWWYGSENMTATMSNIESLFSKMKGRFLLLLRLVNTMTVN